MIKQNNIKELIHGLLDASSFAVLASEGHGQPHASLVAITPFESYNQLIFATYRNTLKYRNLSHNNRVALLIENRETGIKSTLKSNVLTIIGRTEEIKISVKEAAFRAHLKRHPEMESFLLTADCCLMLVIVQSYQLVSGIDDIRWITAEDLDSIEH